MGATNMRTRCRAVGSTMPRPTSPRTTPAAPSWAPTRRPAWSPHLQAGTRAICSSAAHRVPAELRLQPDWHGRRARLLVGQRDHQPVHQVAGAAGLSAQPTHSRGVTAGLWNLACGAAAAIQPELRIKLAQLDKPRRHLRAVRLSTQVWRLVALHSDYDFLAGQG